MIEDRKQTRFFKPVMLVLLFVMVQAANAEAAATKTASPVAMVAAAAAPDPATNPVLAAILKGGAKLYYLGPTSGLDGWFVMKDGQIQIAYSTADKKNVIIGAMFNENGENVTSNQVKALLANNKEVANSMMGALQQLQTTSPPSDVTPPPAVTSSAVMNAASPSPGERLIQALAAAPGVTLGTGAPKLFMVMDTNCPHCQATWRMVRDAVTKNDIQLRLIPIAPEGSDSERTEAVLMHSGDPIGAWDKYVGPSPGKGDKTALIGVADPALLTAIRTNHTLIEDWHIDQTPYLVYRGKDGKVKIVLGEPEKIAAILSDVAP